MLQGPVKFLRLSFIPVHDALLQANGHEHAPCSLLLTKKAWMNTEMFEK